MDKKNINKFTTESLKTPFTARLKKSKTQENKRLGLQGPIKDVLPAANAQWHKDRPTQS